MHEEMIFFMHIKLLQPCFFLSIKVNSYFASTLSEVQLLYISTRKQKIIIHKYICHDMLELIMSQRIL